jgi:hypothetical protein
MYLKFAESFRDIHVPIRASVMMQEPEEPEPVRGRHFVDAAVHRHHMLLGVPVTVHVQDAVVCFSILLPANKFEFEF